MRGAVFNRDQWRCTKCGRTTGGLQAHHVKRLKDGADPYDMAGIVTICRPCHIEHHRPDAMTPGRAEWLDYVRDLQESG